MDHTTAEGESSMTKMHQTFEAGDLNNTHAQLLLLLGTLETIEFLANEGTDTHGNKITALSAVSREMTARLVDKLSSAIDATTIGARAVQ
jgi:hypothetical protein